MICIRGKNHIFGPYIKIITFREYREEKKFKLQFYDF